MDGSWMNESRLTVAYLDGVNEFLNFAFTNACVGGKITCPCSKCKNTMWVTRGEASEHLIGHGFIKNYTKWIAHGEGISSAHAEGTLFDLQDKHMHDGTEFFHDMSGMLHDKFGLSNTIAVGGDTENLVVEGPNKEADDFYKLLKHAEKELFPGCELYSTFSFLVELFNIKCLSKWTDRSFTMWLNLLKNVLLF